MKLSRNIVNSMPTNSLKEIEAREEAFQKLTEAEKFVDRFDQLHTDMLAKDQVKGEDMSELEGVVRHSTWEEGGEDKFKSTEFIASDLNDVKHYMSTTRTIPEDAIKDYMDRYDVELEQLRMESEPKRDRTTYSLRTASNRTTDPQKMKGFNISEDLKPKKMVIVTGQGDDRTFQFEPIGTFQAMWESLSDVAGSISRVFAPIKNMIPEVKFVRKES